MDNINKFINKYMSNYEVNVINNIEENKFYDSNFEEASICLQINNNDIEKKSLISNYSLLDDINLKLAPEPDKKEKLEAMDIVTNNAGNDNNNRNKPTRADEPNKNQADLNIKKKISQNKFLGNSRANNNYINYCFIKSLL